MDILKINNVAIKNPKSLTVTYNDIDGQTTRNAAGYMVRDRICTKVKLEIEWPAMKTSEIASILTAIDAEFFNVTYLDPKAGATITKQMYVGDRTAPWYNVKLGLWQSLKCNFVER